MSQEYLERDVADMQTGGQPDDTIKARAEALADGVQQRYGEAKVRVADLAESVTEEVADRSQRLRDRLREFDSREAGCAVLRRAKNAQWPLLLIGGALGFGLAGFIGQALDKDGSAVQANAIFTRR